MSDISIHISPLVIVAYLMAQAALYAGLPTLVIAGLILASRRRRAHRGWRWSAFMLIGLVAVCAVPLVLYFGQKAADSMRLEARTFRPDRPTLIDGMLFPPGSMVVRQDDGGRVSYGSVPVATIIVGVPLIGAFRLGGADGETTVEDGTLARNALIRDIPCGPGKVVSRPETTNCVLSRDFHFIGHDLAGGSEIEVYRSPLDEPVSLARGTLGRPETLFDTVWPAGTLFTGNGNDAAERIAHYPGPQTTGFMLCVPLGATATLGAAELHGPMGVNLNGDRILVWSFCEDAPGAEPPGYAMVGGARFSEGVRESVADAWVWK
jgi:hypothetical protein